MSTENPMRPIAVGWLQKIEQAQKHKKPFQEDAEEAMSFYDGSHNWMWKDEYSRGERGYNKGLSPPEFRMTINRVWEAVRLFGAVIYHRNPVRNVTPRQYPVIPPELLGIRPQQPVPMMGPNGPVVGPDGQMVMMPDVMMQQYQQEVESSKLDSQKRQLVSRLLEDYLNYTPNELDLKGHSKRVVDEALIKGASVWWTELYKPPGAKVSLAGSFYDSIDNLVWDPDADDYESILWMAKRCSHPVQQVASEYGLDMEDLKGHTESYASRSNESTERGYASKKKNGKTNDLLTYWKIWSKTGFGDRLKDAPKDLQGKFDSLGQNCYIVVAEGVDFPLNIPPELMQEEVDEGGIPPQIFQNAQWPIPFWAEPNGWPCTILRWHTKPGYSWPISLIKPGVSELRFINWAMSFMATKIATSCQTLVGVSKSADPDIKAKILEKAEGGFKIIEISEAIGRNVNEVISVFNLPGVTTDMWQIIHAVTELFDRRVGLTELLYGTTRNQMRSAAEATVKSEQISVRPDDYANTLEDALSEVARKEALLARWMITPEDIAPLLGRLSAAAWKMHVQAEDPESIVREYDYRVEAGTARKPNKGSKVEQINAAMQILMPVAQGMMQAGKPELFNALMQDFGRALDIDVTNYHVDPPPPPPPQQALPAPQPNQPPPPPQQPQGPPQ